MRLLPSLLSHSYLSCALSQLSLTSPPSPFPDDWGANCIHGVQSRCGTGTDGKERCPTSFPGPNFLGATFNRSSWRAMGGVIGRELRSLWYVEPRGARTAGVGARTHSTSLASFASPSLCPSVPPPLRPSVSPSLHTPPPTPPPLTPQASGQGGEPPPDAAPAPWPRLLVAQRRHCPRPEVGQEHGVRRRGPLDLRIL